MCAISAHQGAGMGLRASFHLKGRMSDVVGMGQCVSEFIQPDIAGMPARHHQVRGKCDIASTERPHVQIVHARYPWLLLQELCDGRAVEVGRYRVQRKQSAIA